MSLRLPDHWLWDFWFARDGDDVHLFFLHAPRSAGDPDLRHRSARIGHAVSRDLRDWQLLPMALGPGAPAAFDDQAIRWLRDGDVRGALAGCSFDRLTAAGNVSQAFLTLVLAMGVARGSRPFFLETLPVLGTIEGFVAWDPRA